MYAIDHTIMQWWSVALKTVLKLDEDVCGSSLHMESTLDIIHFMCNDNSS